MAILRFRVYFEEDESIYRDVLIKHTQTFSDFRTALLLAFEFDQKHQATFYRSNDRWQHGREITAETYDKEYKAPPLLMAETLIGSEIKETNQRFIFQYDFAKNWIFLIELINITKEESSKIAYPSVARSVGITPRQYGAKGLLGEKFADVEEKFDLAKILKEKLALSDDDDNDDKIDIDEADADQTDTESVEPEE